MPIVLIVIFLILAAVLRAEIWKRRFFYLALAMLIFFSNSFIANEVMRMWEVDPIPLEQVKKEYELAIVLGGTVKGDTYINDRIFLDRGDRMYHPVILYKQGKVKKIFASGGTSRLIDVGHREGKQMIEVYENMGVNRNDLAYEIESRNTYENALKSIEWMDGKFDQSDVVLITSAFHMRRAHACFEKLNFNLDTFSCDIYTSKRRWTFDKLFIPSVDAFKIWHILIKEWLGMIAYWLVGYV